MLRRITSGVLVLVSLAAGGVAWADSPTASSQVRVALDGMHRYVRNDANGQRWKRFLMSDQLTAQLGKGSAANREVLAAILRKYSGAEYGLHRPEFVAVKNALTAWIAELEQPEPSTVQPTPATAQPALTPGQPAQVQPGNLAATARDAKSRITPVTAQQATQAKVKLAAAVRDLENWLRRAGAARSEGWKKYLGWSDLEHVVAQDGPPDAEAVARAHGKLTANKNGLELSYFRRVRDALTEYSKVASAADNPQLQEQAGQQLDTLAAAIEAYDANPGASDDALAIGRALAWLDRTGQAGSLAHSIRQKYGQPNLYGSVSERLAAVGMEQYVDQVTGVRENILGTDLHGTARMTGHTTLSFLENPRAATLNIFLSGTAVSNNVGYNGPVTVRTTGVTSVAGNKQLQMTADGLVAFLASANCRTNSTLHSLNARCCLVEKIGRRRAAEQKPQAEAIASGRASARVAASMDRQAAPMVAEQNARYQEKLKQPLQRRNAFPEDLTFSSTVDRASVRVLDVAAGRLGAPSGPPQQEGLHDLALRVHESLPVNMGETMLGGFEMTDLRLEKLIKDDLKTELPEELRVTLADGTLDPDKEPWSIIFAKELPVRAKFQDGGLWVAIRAEGFTRGEGDTPGKYKPAITELVEISAAYKIEKTDVGATLRRDGDVVIRFPSRANPDQITVRDNAIVTFMRRKFRNMFKEEFAGQGIKLKDRWEKAGTLRLAEIKSSDAWLSLGWQMPLANPPAAE
ncbi:MAG: hypothetical protein L0211_07995 [Planctomycetaceae bacterium]|nr:hypothetical protein [Planctomycetaceae bacterium]